MSFEFGFGSEHPPEVLRIIKDRILDGYYAGSLGQGQGIDDEPFDFVVNGNLVIDFVSWDQGLITLRFTVVDPQTNEPLLDFGTYTLQTGESITMMKFPPWPVYLDTND